MVRLANRSIEPAVSSKQLESAVYQPRQPSSSLTRSTKPSQSATVENPFIKPLFDRDWITKLRQKPHPNRSNSSEGQVASVSKIPPEFPKALLFDVDLKAWKSPENCIPVYAHEYADLDEDDGRLIVVNEVLVGIKPRKGRMGRNGSLTHAIARNIAIPMMESVVELLRDKDGFELVNLSDREINAIAQAQAKREYEDQALFGEASRRPNAKTIAQRLKKKRQQAIEATALHLGIVGGNVVERIRSRCSVHTREYRVAKEQAAQQFLKDHVMVNSINGNKFSLADAGRTREKCRAEMLCILKGLQAQAESLGLAWARVVLTVPAHMHPNPAFGCNSWDGTMPDDSAHWMQVRWTKVRARLKKRGIALAGFWTREAHADAAPHLNLLFYYPAEAKQFIFETFQTVFGFSESAMSWEDGDTINKAQFATFAASYFLKYFCDPITNPDVMDEQAWASCWNLRRHGFFGIPPLSAWRRLRAQRTPPKVRDIQLLAAWRAARRGDASAWIGLSGGLGKPNASRPIKPLYIPHRQSRVCVGVASVSGATIINKIPGQWCLQRQPKPIVTLALSYPRVAEKNPAEGNNAGIFSRSNSS